jgi:hypothetical protein
MKSFRLAALAVAALAVLSCKKDDPTPTDPTPQFGTVVLEMDHVWGMSMAPFAMNTALKHPMTGDTLTFTTFKYYVSNIQLKRTDGTWWAAEESYYIVDLTDPESAELPIPQVPAGDYVAVRMTLGVDSTRNVSGAQTGALDPANGMFWSWNSGYIMLKAEGTSPQSSDGQFSFHLGGFYGANNAVTEREFPFNGSVLTASPSAMPMIHMMANPARLWHSGTSLSTTSKVHMPGPTAATMKGNFDSWVYLDHIHN